VKQHTRSVVWAYVVEIILGILVYVLLLVTVGPQFLGDVLSDHWATFCTVGLALFAAGFAGLVCFARFLDSEFGKYLKWRGADEHYLRAYVVQEVMFLGAVLASFATAVLRYGFLVHVTWLILLGATVNSLTVLINTRDLIRLRQQFVCQRDAIAKDMHEDE